MVSLELFTLAAVLVAAGPAPGQNETVLIDFSVTSASVGAGMLDLNHRLDIIIVTNKRCDGPTSLSLVEASMQSL